MTFVNNTASSNGASSPQETLADRLSLPRKKRGAKARTALFSALFAVILLYPNFRVGKVSGISMVPKYKSGDTVVLLKSYRVLSPLHVGDIVIAKPQGEGIGGEEVIKRVVFIQNKEGNAPWPRDIENSRGKTRSAELFPQLALGLEVAKPGEIYLLGDNMDHSMDSRDFGPITDKEILGKVITF